MTVTSRSRGPIDKAVAAGAIDGGTHDAVVRASEVTIVCVPRSSDVVDVLDAAMPALGEGKIVVDASTIDPDIERAQHERDDDRGAIPGGTAFGQDRGAEQGTLTLMVGGDAECWRQPAQRSNRSRERSSTSAVPGSGQIVKLCNNLLYAAQTLATAEATTMAAKAGVDLRKSHEGHRTRPATATQYGPASRSRGVLPDGPARTIGSRVS